MLNILSSIAVVIGGILSPAPEVYVRAEEPPVYYSFPNGAEESIADMIKREAESVGVSPTLAVAIARAESDLIPTAKNKNSSAKGLFQIMNATWEGCEGDPLNPRDNTLCAMKYLVRGEFWRWKESYNAWSKEYLPVPCSCIKSARHFGVPLPHLDAKDIKPNSLPVVGGLALFNYSGMAHVAVITSLEAEGFRVREGNKDFCEFGQRFVRWDGENLKGFAKF